MCFGEGEIFELELKNFAGAQAVQQHQGHDGQIAKGAKAFPETGDLVGGKGRLGLRSRGHGLVR